MPYIDSIQQPLIDTATVVQNNSLAIIDSLHRVDSLAIIDSIARVDSIAAADSIKAHLMSGFAGLPIPSLPSTESWVFSVFIGLFFLMLFSLWRSKSWMYESMRNFFKLKERTSIFSKTTVSDFQSKLFIVIFSIGVFSLYGYLLLWQEIGRFSILIFAKLYLVAIIFMLLKVLLFQLIGYVFLQPVLLKVARDSYFNLFSFLGILLFPVVLFLVYSPEQYHYSISILIVVISIFMMLMYVFKLFQLFLQKIVVSFYIMLYLCTLEFLPYTALVGVFKFIVSSV